MSSVSRPHAGSPQRLIRRYAGARLYDTVHRRLVSLPAIRMPAWLDDAPGHPSPDTSAEPPATGAGDCAMSVSRRACEAVVVVTVHGRMDIDGCAAVDHRLQSILAAGNLSRLVLDLSRLRHLDDFGVRAVLRAADAARATGIGLRIVTGDGAARQALDERAALTLLPTAPDVDTACAVVLTRLSPDA